MQHDAQPDHTAPPDLIGLYAARAGVFHEADLSLIASCLHRAATHPKPTALQRVHAALSVAIHGAAAGARARETLMWPLKLSGMTEPALSAQADRVLQAALRGAVAGLPPQVLDQISLAVEQALADWPPALPEPRDESRPPV